MKYKAKMTTHKDPVCGMEVSQISAIAETEYQGKTYYFCAGICKQKFEEDPDKYIGNWSAQHKKMAESMGS